MARKRRRLGELLREWNIVTDQQLDEALKVAQGSRQRLGEVLVELGYADETQVAKALASQFDMEFVDLDEPNVVQATALELIPHDLIKKYGILPMGKEGDRLKLIVPDPMDLALIDDLRFRLGGEVEMALAGKKKIRDTIDRMLGGSRSGLEGEMRNITMDADGVELVDSDAEQTKDKVEDAQQAPIVRLVHEVIKEAVLGRASDIHIEPFEDRVRLRYRIDGVCHERDRIPKRTQSSVIARLKIMAGVKIEEKRIPQDGRIKLKIGGEIIDFRVSFCPAYHGESVVLRILRSEGAKLGLEHLGMRHDTLEVFNGIIRRPNGIFLVTGPTGSGKTTTLYSALGVLNRPDRKIITAEDPIEYNFKGINQCQVNEGIGLSFAKILRAMLRQAPNIILVGEIRDREVGEVAIQAALTGHLVFSTLHTNDAPSAITRLIDMGLKPFLVASSIQAVLGQRLVRMLCPKCKQPDTSPNRKMMNLIGLRPEDLANKTIYKAVGCQQCSNTGYRGRKGIYELMVMNADLRELAFNRAPLGQIRQAAIATGMRTLLGDGKLKVLDGLTTIDEVARLAQVEGIVDELATEDIAA